MVKLISITPDAEKIIAHCARVSSDKQDNPEYEKLLTYCAKNGHWSVFQMANCIMEITCSRAISAQILRHKSMDFQEFSQRYQEVNSYVPCEARRQDVKNRQNSIDDLDLDTKIWFRNVQDDVWNSANILYKQALNKGISKENARMILPLNTQTRLYVNGSIRSWIHYVNVRSSKETQLEHREIALACKQILCDNLPIVAKAMGWKN